MIQHFGVKITPIESGRANRNERWLIPRPGFDESEWIIATQTPSFPFSSWEAAQAAFTQWQKESSVAKQYQQVAQLVALDMSAIPQHAIQA